MRTIKNFVAFPFNVYEIMIKYDSQFRNLFIALSQFWPAFQRSQHWLDTLGKNIIT